MKRVILLLLLLQLTTLGKAQLDDTDKHFIAGSTISVATTLIAKKLVMPYPEIKGLIVAGFAGLAKEFIDHSYHHMRLRDEPNAIYYDHIGDFFYTLSGGMSATLLMAVVLKIIDHYKQPDYLMPVN